MTAGPTVEVGDWIKINAAGKYHEVIAVDSDHSFQVADRRWFTGDYITTSDVYTKAAQEANGALVQFEPEEGNHAYDAIASDIGLSGSLTAYRHDWFAFLTPEATAELGEFQPVPDRDIVPGDCVRDDRLDAVYIWKSHHRPDHRVSLVAREDPAFIAPPVIKEPEPAPVCGEPVGAGTYGCPSVYGPPPACMLAAGHDGQHEPDPAPPIPEAWNLVQAGDGHLYRAGKRRPGGRYWSRADRNDLLSMPGAELPRPVRRAVVVTLPDIDPEAFRVLPRHDCDLFTGGTCEYAGASGATWHDLDKVKQYSAELLAAALHAEEGR